ncbi:MAG: radical SAM protein [Bacteroidales bacterium]|nr:radical SAM protein [Bacteroidales bacterium]
MLTFGPIPSRRLGRSLGINNIPPKYCSYFCVYCQIGTALEIGTERRSFYKTEQILEEIKQKIDHSEKSGEKIDYLTFVPDGEPTLDLNIGKEISEIKKITDIPIAVITNSSLLWDKQVREELHQADWVSVKVDTINTKIWRKINHPSRKLDLEQIKQGTLAFAEEFNGKLMTETMLIKDMNDSTNTLQENADFIARLNPDTAFLAIPTRPPAKSTGQPPREEVIAVAYQTYSAKINHVETLLGYEGNAYAASGNSENDILSVTAVHPMRKDAVEDLLKKNKSDWKVVQRLIEQDLLKEVRHGEHTFYLRKLKKKPK